MTAPHDKLAGIKPGDRVRVTFEGVVDEVSEVCGVRVGNGRDFCWVGDKLTPRRDHFQIERIEPPLKVGDRVVDKKAPETSEGEILHIHKDRAWVLWRAAMNIYDDAVFPVTRLERIP